MPRIVKTKDGTISTLVYSYLEDLAVNKLYGRNKERNSQKRKVLNKIIT